MRRKLNRLGELFRKKETTATVREVVPDGLVPISDVLPDDIFVVGYPKSGNTWFQNLISVAVFGLDLTLSPFGLVQELVPDINERKYYRRYATPMYFKSHSLPRREYRRVVYLLRDGRDAMVSYRHYREIVDRRAYDFRSFVAAENALYPCHWAEHVEAWAENPFSSEIITVRYEDLLARPVEEMRRFCTFAGIERSTSQLQSAAAATEFRMLRKKEADEGNWHPDFKAAQFFRRGEVGSFRDEMSADVLSAFLESAGPTLTRFGYTHDEIERASPAPEGA